MLHASDTCSTCDAALNKGWHIQNQGTQLAGKLYGTLLTPTEAKTAAPCPLPHQSTHQSLPAGF
jgi:hypothetical protein